MNSDTLIGLRERDDSPAPARGRGRGLGRTAGPLIYALQVWENIFGEKNRESSDSSPNNAESRFSAAPRRGRATPSGLIRPRSSGLFTRSVLDSVFTDGWSFTPS